MIKLLIILFLIPFFSRAQQITIKVTLTGTPVWMTKLVPANLKYNKWGRLGMTVDDRQTGALDLSAYMHGGVSPQNHVTYTGLTFTDGANTRAKNIYYSGSLATNSWYNLDSTQDADVNAGTMNWMQTDTVAIMREWSLLDHGAFHGIGLPGAVALGFNTLQNSAANRNYVFRQLAVLGDQYVMRYGVVPTNDRGYHSAWEQEGFVGGSSESTNDGYPNTVFGLMNHGLVNVTNWKSVNSYKVHLRRFRELITGNTTDNFTDGATALVAQSNSTTSFSFEYGMHQNNIDTIKRVMDSVHLIANDHIWVCGLQEFMEYFETIQQTGIKQSISGNVLKVILDQSYLPADLRWRDMTLLLNSNVGISSVSVSGADDYSYNTSTGLINIYRKKTTGFVIPPNYQSTGFVFNAKVPLNIKNFYQDNNYDNKPTALIDGDTTTQFHATVYDNAMIYSPYDVVVDLSDYGTRVTEVRLFVSAGGNYTTKVILTRNDNEAEDSIGVFTNQSSARWLIFYPDTSLKKFVSSRLILRSTSPGGYGNELQLYADYLPYVEQTYASRNVPLGNMLGTNAHWWNFVNTAVGSSSALVMNKINAFDSLKLHSLRNYGNAQEYTYANGAQYAFNPVMQGWFEDLFMRALKTANPTLIRWSVLQGQFHHVAATWNTPDTTWQMKGKVVSYVDHGSWGTVTIGVFSANGTGLWTEWFVDPVSGSATSQTSKAWISMPTTFPTNENFNVAGGVAYTVGDTILVRAQHVSALNYNYENNNNAGRSTLTTWDTLGRLAYNWAARKGLNPNATKFIPYAPHNTGIEDNNDSVGIGTSEWTEVMNEPNAFWAGYDNYLNGNHLGAAWSKIYDNNKVFSTTIGAKNADPNITVSSSGLAVGTVDLNRSADYWAKKNRQNRPKTFVVVQPNNWRSKTFGWVDNPYDVIQFHDYSSTGGSNQYAGGTQAGLPPELSSSLVAVDEFVWFRNKYAPWAQVDVGEWGYDVNQNSSMNAPSIGSYNAEEVRGAWAIRTLLGFNAHGVDNAQWYRLYQDSEADSSNSTQFATMSLLKENGDGTISRRIVGNNFRQITEFGDYIFNAQLSSSPMVLRFKKDTSYMYAIWGVEGITVPTGQKPIFTNTTGTYNLNLPNGTSVVLRQFQDNGDVMTSSSPAIVSGTSYPVSYDLKPVFVLTGVEDKKYRKFINLKK